MTRIKLHPLPSILFAMTAAFQPLALNAAGNSGDPQPATRITVVQSDAFGLEMDVELIQLDIQPAPEGAGYDISLSGESREARAERPDLPHISRLVAVPPDAAIALEWDGGESRMVANRPPVMVVDDAGAPSAVSMNSWQQTWSSFAVSHGGAAAVADGFWPPKVVTMDDPIIMRGNRMVRVTVYPVQVNAAGDLKV